MDVLIEAGRGLAAAHDAGLVHLDFKPSNVLVGEDGRVRVADFGLARAVGGMETSPVGSTTTDVTVDERVTQTGRVAGTPAYMAPEQSRRADVSPRCDQFSFCVTAWEALFGTRPPGRLGFSPELRADAATAGVPPGVVTALRKGMSTRPDDRHRSMDELLRTLQTEAAILRGATRPHRWRGPAWLMGTTVILASTATGAHRWHRSRLVAACEAEGAAITNVWNEDAREAVRTGLLATNVGYAADTVERVLPRLDAYADDWSEHATTACMNATVHDTWRPERLSKAQWCLEERRLTLAAAAARFAEADERVVPKAAPIVFGLPRLDACTDDGTLELQPAPPTKADQADVAEVRKLIALAKAEYSVGHYEEALELALDAEKQAADVGWDPVLQRARLEIARIRGHQGEHEASREIGRAVFFAAAHSGDWAVARSAAYTVAIGYAKQAKSDEALLWTDLQSVGIAWGGDAAGLHEADRIQTLAILYQRLRQHDKAANAYSEAAIRTRAVLGDSHPRVASGLVNALMERVMQEDSDPGLIDQALEPLAAVEVAYGSDHPDSVQLRAQLGAAHANFGDYDGAIELLEPALTRAEQAFGSNHGVVISIKTNLAVCYRSTSRIDEALTLLQDALTSAESTFGAEHPVLSTIMVNIATIYEEEENYQEVRRYLEMSLRSAEQTLGPDHVSHAERHRGIAKAMIELGEFESAMSHLEQAIRIGDRGFPPGSWKHTRALQTKGRLHLRRGEPTKAIPPLEHALGLLVSEGKEKEDSDFADMTARVESALGEALWEAPVGEGRDRRRAHELKRSAVKRFDANATPSAAESVRTWLSEHPV